VCCAIHLDPGQSRPITCIPCPVRADGALQGRSKQETVDEFGVEQVS